MIIGQIFPWRRKSSFLKRCPIENYKNKLVRQKVLDQKHLDKIYNEIDIEITNSFAYAKKSKFPKNSKLMKVIYA